MKLFEIISYSLKSLRHRRVRSWLTILGIVIGIGAVVSLLTIGQSFNRQVERQFSILGSNTVFVSPVAESKMSSAGFGNMPPSAGKLRDRDADRLKRVPEITDISRLVMSRSSVEFKGVEISATVQGVEPGVFEKTTAIGMDEGRFLQESDKHVVVIGRNIADKTFGANKKVGINSYLAINGVKYRVVGIIEKSGGGFTFQNLDNSIIVAFRDAREMFKDTLGEDGVGAIAFRFREGAGVQDVVERAKLELDASRKVRPDQRDYSVISPEQIQRSIGTVLGLVTLFLGAVASISLIVGGLSIASSMFTSVLERTHEIGVLKAVGAKSSDIRRIFIFESGAIGGVGGLVGCALAAAAVYAAGAAGLPAEMDAMIMLFGLAFALAIGLLSGYLPAKRAAALAPIEALRYE